MKLEERDKRILARLGTRIRSVVDLAASLDVPPEDLDDRLADLADNSLVYDLGDSRYERTESGRRVLVTSAAVPAAERIDTSPEIERAIDEFALRSDEADAVRHVFALLRYWGWVTEAEIVDAIYSEAAAGRETAEEWWDGLIREPLAALPSVEQPTGDDEPWRYTGTPEAGGLFTDGRRVLSRTHPVYGDVKHALESLELTEEEREAARAAFGYLYRRGEVTDCVPARDRLSRAHGKLRISAGLVGRSGRGYVRSPSWRRTERREQMAISARGWVTRQGHPTSSRARRVPNRYVQYRPFSPGGRAGRLLPLRRGSTSVLPFRVLPAHVSR